MAVSSWLQFSCNLFKLDNYRIYSPLPIFEVKPSAQFTPGGKVIFAGCLQVIAPLFVVKIFIGSFYRVPSMRRSKGAVGAIFTLISRAGSYYRSSSATPAMGPNTFASITKRLYTLSTTRFFLPQSPFHHKMDHRTPSILFFSSNISLNHINLLGSCIAFPHGLPSGKSYRCSANGMLICLLGTHAVAFVSHIFIHKDLRIP